MIVRRHRWQGVREAGRNSTSGYVATFAAASSTVAAIKGGKDTTHDAAIENMYQRKTPIEHVLLRPGMYIGATDAAVSSAWVVEGADGQKRKAGHSDHGRMVKKDVAYSPGLLKLFDEILVNACDNKARDPSGMGTLGVVIEPGSGAPPGSGKAKGDYRPPRVTITNDGQGIPVALHPKEGLYVPDLIFGQLLTGSNFGDGGAGGSSPKGTGTDKAGKDKKMDAGGKGPKGKAASPSPSVPAGDSDTTGGRHGYGAKLTNIFSVHFTVETYDASRGLWYRQQWRDNMQVREEPVIMTLPELQSRDPAAYAGLVFDKDSGQPVGFTRVSFVPDLARFGKGSHDGAADKASQGHVGLAPSVVSMMKRRVYDAAGTLAMLGGRPVTVSLNGHTVPVHDWTGYVKLYQPGSGKGHGGHKGSSAGAAEDASKDSTTAGAEDQADQVVPHAFTGLQLDKAIDVLSSLQHARLGKRLEVAVAPAGLKLAPTASSTADGAGSGEDGTAAPAAAPGGLSEEALESYNSPGCVASFVNGIATSRHGTHVSLVHDALARRVAEHCQKRLKKAGGNVTVAAPSAGSAGGGQGLETSGVVKLKPESITPSLVKAHMRLWVNARLPGPTFDSQSKEQLVTGPEQVARALVVDTAAAEESILAPSAALAAVDSLLTDKFVRSVADETGVYSAVVAGLVSKAGAELARSLRKASRPASDSKIKAIPKLEDANWAGTKRASECTLILTEGDSAKALAVAGLAVVGRDRYGVFPLRGKLLNVRDVSVKTALSNAEISSLVTILGLDLRASYANSTKDSRGLRYGRVMIMADQDVDGSHIKGLVINLLHAYWPRLLESSTSTVDTFVQAFVTPVIKARAGSGHAAVIREFYSLAQFESWRLTNPEASSRSWSIKYYKGLGTSTSEEGRAYFKDLPKHVRPFVWGGQTDDHAIRMAFSKDKVEERKAWIANATDRDEAAASATVADVQAQQVADDTFGTAVLAGPADGALATTPAAPAASDTSNGTTFSSFVNQELIAFSRADLARSVPSVLDGLKPSQRKVLHACFKRSGGAAAGGTSSGPAAVSAAIRALSLSVPVVDTDVEGQDGEGQDGEGGASQSGADGQASAQPGGKDSIPKPRDPTEGLRLGGEVKVAQLAGYVAEHTAYHHGEASLNSTIVGMAQDYLGANNVPLLVPSGQFGTRLQGGKDAASARYIFTRLAPASRLLCPPIDDDLLARKQDDGSPVEPVAYLPVVPLLLLNGAAGIGTGWSTNVPSFHPLDVVDAVWAGLDQGWATAGHDGRDGALEDPAAPLLPPSWQAPFALDPWWKGFAGHTMAVGGTGTGTGTAWPEGFATWGKAEWLIQQGAGSLAGEAKGKAKASGTSSGAKRSSSSSPSSRVFSTLADQGGLSLDGTLGLDASNDDWSGGEAWATAWGDLSSSSTVSSSRSGDYMDGLLDGVPDPALARGPRGSTTVRISELPVGRWTEEYKAFLQGLLARGAIKDLREYHTESRAEFIVTISPEGMAEIRSMAGAAAIGTGAAKDLPEVALDRLGISEKKRARAGKTGDGKDASQWPGWSAAVAASRTDPDALLWPALHAWLKLSTAYSTRNMHAFDPVGHIRRYSSPWEVVRQVMPVRGAAYLARAARLEAVLTDAHTRAAARARFLAEVTAGRLVVAGGSKGQLVKELWERGFPTFDGTRPGHGAGTGPSDHARAVHALPQALKQVLALDNVPGINSTDTAKGASGPGTRSYDYLLSLPLWQLTGESLARAQASVSGLSTALEASRKASLQSLWTADLDNLHHYWAGQAEYRDGWVPKHGRAPVVGVAQGSVTAASVSGSSSNDGGAKVGAAVPAQSTRSTLPGPAKAAATNAQTTKAKTAGVATTDTAPSPKATVKAKAAAAGKAKIKA